MEDLTPRGKIVSHLRMLWLTSRERSEALKRDNYTCRNCLRKATTKKGQEFKVQVHHKEGVLNWDEMVDSIYKYLLVDPDKLVCLCKECHDKVTYMKGDIKLL